MVTTASENPFDNSMVSTAASCSAEGGGYPSVKRRQSCDISSAVKEEYELTVASSLADCSFIGRSVGSVLLMEADSLDRLVRAGQPLGALQQGHGVGGVYRIKIYLFSQEGSEHPCTN